MASNPVKRTTVASGTDFQAFDNGASGPLSQGVTLCDSTGAAVSAQPVTSHGVASTGNTSTTPLGSSATFTGAWEQNNLNDVMVSCHTDAPGTLFFDFSPDGVANNSFPVGGFEVAAGIHEFHVAVKGPRQFRVRLVNDTTAQTFLRLYTYYGNFRQGNLPVSAPIASDADAIVVRSVGSETDLAFGRFGGMSEGEKFGSVQLIDSADCPVDIWSYGSDDTESGADKTFLTAAADLFVSSDNAADTNVDVTVEYIDSTGAGATVTVNTNGMTPVDLGDNGFDINRAYVSGATAPVGNLYFNTENNHLMGVPIVKSTVLAFIKAGYGQTQLATRTVELGKLMRIKSSKIGIARASGADGSAEVHLQVREFGKTWIVKRVLHLTTSLPFNGPIAGVIVPARANVKFTLFSVSDPDTNVNASWIYELVDA